LPQFVHINKIGMTGNKPQLASAPAILA